MDLYKFTNIIRPSPNLQVWNMLGVKPQEVTVNFL